MVWLTTQGLQVIPEIQECRTSEIRLLTILVFNLKKPLNHKKSHAVTRANHPADGETWDSHCKIVASLLQDGFKETIMEQG